MIRKTKGNKRELLYEKNLLSKQDTAAPNVFTSFSFVFKSSVLCLSHIITTTLPLSDIKSALHIKLTSPVTAAVWNSCSVLEPVGIGPAASGSARGLLLTSRMPSGLCQNPARGPLPSRVPSKHWWALLETAEAPWQSSPHILEGSRGFRRYC